MLALENKAGSEVVGDMKMKQKDKPLNILIYEDSARQRRCAEGQLRDHNLTFPDNFQDALEELGAFDPDQWDDPEFVKKTWPNKEDYPQREKFAAVLVDLDYNSDLGIYYGELVARCAQEMGVPYVAVVTLENRENVLGQKVHQKREESILIGEQEGITYFCREDSNLYSVKGWGCALRKLLENEPNRTIKPGSFKSLGDALEKSLKYGPNRKTKK